MKKKIIFSRRFLKRSGFRQKLKLLSIFKVLFSNYNSFQRSYFIRSARSHKYFLRKIISSFVSRKSFFFMPRFLRINRLFKNNKAKKQLRVQNLQFKFLTSRVYTRDIALVSLALKQIGFYYSVDTQKFSVVETSRAFVSVCRLLLTSDNVTRVFKLLFSLLTFFLMRLNKKRQNAFRLLNLLNIVHKLLGVNSYDLSTLFKKQTAKLSYLVSRRFRISARVFKSCYAAEQEM